ncbi:MULTISPECIES: type VII secretion integral membrane protein EccD [unclassified Streptomyces]|uniref:type VII secretion integral membrane protein EccD n=1 Tax=unclassified Streptomyces TaxID=2593676 RepID=UPI000DAB8E40|nr:MULTISPECIES: type VII secretion integral membrane protein EccD [unclassified Streptomyces]PZT72386.1 type VII secretion integral membrane protein EccD [Streptomyces sp. AC1-42T]PZT81296.1 type VII secretion integral membrane protein EccD [Streptomyces sp. AC1-42W]
MSSTVTTAGFCRITVVAPDGRIDVALPDDVPVADLLPEILRLTGQEVPPGTPPGFHLTRRDNTVLDATHTLGVQRVPDGDVLRLRPFTESLPPAVFDDVADAVASAVRRDRALWSDRLLGAAGLFGGALLLVLTAFVLWFADPVRHDMHGLPGIVAAAVGGLLAVLAGVRARRYGDRASAVALGLAALPHVMIAGSGLLALDPGTGAGRLQFMLGCAAVLVVSAGLVVALPAGDAPFVAVVSASAVGTLAAFLSIVAEARPRETAAVCVVVAIGAVAFLPGLSARVARLPIGYAAPQSATDADPDDEPGLGDPDPVDTERIAVRARRGHELLLGLVGGCCLVVVAAGAVLGFSADGWARGLALVAGLATLLRARLFRHTAQVATVLGAGIIALSLLVIGLALHPPADAVAAILTGEDPGALDLRTLWLALAVTAGAALLTGIALVVPRKGLSPFWGRLSDLAEILLLLALIPLCLAVLDLYAAARSMTS